MLADPKQKNKIPPRYFGGIFYWSKTRTGVFTLSLQPKNTKPFHALFVMKNTLILLLICCACLRSQAQEITDGSKPAAPQTANTLIFPEPEFIGHVLAVLSNNTSIPLAQESLSPRHRNSTGAILFGIGRTHIDEMVLNTPKSATRIRKGDGIALIVRVPDNQFDPMSEVNVFRFKTTRKLRLAEYASESTLGDKTFNTLERQPFTARKFGTSSYMLILKGPQAGEYGISVNGSGDLNVSTFGIDE